MAAKRANIRNIKTLAKGYRNGGSLAGLADKASPKRVGIPALRRALVDAGVKIRRRRIAA